MERRIRFTVPRDKEGVVLIDFLASRFPYFTPREWEARIERGSVRVNGETVPARCALCFRDVLEYLAWDVPEPEVPADVLVVHRDDEIAVIDKPAGLPCHPGGRYFNNTAWAILKARHGIEDPAFVNRLDRETSGLMLVALSPRASKRCQAQFARRSVEKEYLALVEGRFPGRLRAEGIIGPDRGSTVRKRRLFRMAGREEQVHGALDREWQPADTEFETVAYHGEITELKARPRTGRLHQIRATLRALGFPIVGDKLYGRDPGVFLRFCDGSLTDADRTLLRMERQALHASRLAFRHPADNRPLEFTSPVPADMIKAAADAP
jgi:RluA family pseudouridine synthase